MFEMLKDYHEYCLARFYGGIGIWYGNKYMSTNSINYGVKSIKYFEKCYDHYPDSYAGKGGLYDGLEAMKSYVNWDSARRA